MSDISQFKIEQDNSDHFMMKHPDGSSFKIAKGLLSKEAHEHIKKMCSGGVAHYVDGTNDAEPEDMEDPTPTEDTGVVPQAQQAPTSTPSVQYIPQGDQNATPGNLLEQALPEYATAFKTQEQALTGGAAAKGQQGTDTGKVLDTTVKSLEQLQQDDVAHQNKIHQDSVNFKNQLAQGTIDPDRLYSHMGTGQRIATAIGMILGGLGGSATGGRNLVVDHMADLIKQDVDAQKADTANKQNLYHLNLAQSGSEQQASLSAQRQIMDAAQVNLESVAAKSVDPIEKQRAQAGIGALQQQQAGIDNSLRLYNWQVGLRQGPFDIRAAAALQPAERANVIRLPDGKTGVLANSPKAAEAANTALTDTQSAIDSLNALKSIHTIRGSLSEKAEQVNAQLPIAAVRLQKAIAGGRFSPEKSAYFQELLNNPKELRQQFMDPVKTDTLINELKNQQQLTLQNSSSAYRNPNIAAQKGTKLYGR